MGRKSAPRRCVVLLSGGLDSATTLAVARSEGFETHALSFRYGQRHDHELRAASRIAAALGAASHHLMTIDFGTWGGSALTDPGIAVPKDRAEAEIGAGIPVTYVPARNTVFLSCALAWAEVLEARDIFIGVNALDYSGYPDCRPEFLAAFERVAALGTRSGLTGAPIRVHAPLVRLSKAEIIRRGLGLGVDYALTHSCYDPSAEGVACGRCDACLLRLKGFREAGSDDPIPYQTAGART